MAPAYKGSLVQNRKATVAFILAMQASLAGSVFAADMGDEIKFDWRYSEPVVFSEDHDPEEILLKDGRELDIWFQAIPAEEVFTWKPGRKLTISYTLEDGLWLVDDATGKKDRVLGGLDDKYHPISILLDRCVKQNGSTYGMSACTYLATKQWDSEMTRAYQAILSLVPEQKHSQLIEAQRAWIKFRDAQTHAIGLLYDKQGTIWGMLAYDEIMDLTQNQAKRLWGYVAETDADPGDFASDAEEKKTQSNQQ